MSPYYARRNARPVLVDPAGQVHTAGDVAATVINLEAHERLLLTALRTVQDALAARRAQLDQLRAMEADHAEH